MHHYWQLIRDRLGLSLGPARDPEEHLHAAVAWLLRAQQATPDDGESDEDDTVADVESDKNQEKAAEQSSLTQQSIQVQSITGLARDRFQLTGEYTRNNGNKVLLTTRIEQMVIEQLKSNFFRLTVAHQWIWQSFQMRLGIGMQYFVLSGRDLDEEQIDEAGVQPAFFYERVSKILEEQSFTGV